MTAECSHVHTHFCLWKGLRGNTVKPSYDFHFTCYGGINLVQRSFLLYTGCRNMNNKCQTSNNQLFIGELIISFIASFIV